MAQGEAQGSSRKAATCPKCHGEMREGFLLDYGDNFTAWATRWMEGKPERSFWKGVKRTGRSEIPVAAYRCQSCGFVEIYAK